MTAVIISCEKTRLVETKQKIESEIQQTPPIQQVSLDKTPVNKVKESLYKAGIPQDMVQNIVRAADSGEFFADMNKAMVGDPYLRFLVDKKHALPDNYKPSDLVELNEGGAYRAGRSGLMLRQAAEQSLEKMARAAQTEGVTLVASSAYRSYQYQVTVYNRNVREMGEEAADRESARPGNSQHQTGLVIDFGSIDDSFAQTKAGKWLLANAGKFGWSLSFPDGYEEITGYRWESWHYRYVGTALSHFIDAYFNGIQQYALQFLHEWEMNGFSS